MPATYEPISTTTLGSATATVSFSSIPGTYTDLVLIIDGAMASSGNTVYCRINGNTGSNYSTTYVGGNGSSAYSGRGSNRTDGVNLGGFQSGYTTGRYTIVATFMNYSNATTNKTVLSRWNDTGGSVEASVSLFRSTDAITSLEVRNNGGQNFVSGSMFTLYGIAAA
jgi:hypothetical protein